MKKIMPVLMLVALVVGGYWFYTTQLGGSVNGPTKGLPTVKPQVPDVGDSANKGAKGAQDGANWLADTIADLSPTTWRLIGVLMIVGAIVWVIKNPKRLAIALGVVCVGLIVMLIG